MALRASCLDGAPRNSSVPGSDSEFFCAGQRQRRKHTQIEELVEESRETGRQQFVMDEVGLFLPVIKCYEHATLFIGALSARS